MVLRTILIWGVFVFTHAHAQQRIQVDVIPNFVGAGAGVTTEWLGSKDTVTGVAPGGRVALEDMSCRSSRWR